MISHLVGVQKRKMENKESRWMSYAEAEAHRKFMNRREQEFLHSQGLGWLIEFCSKPINKEEDKNDDNRRMGDTV